MKRLAILLVCMLLVGCATTGEWTKTDTEQFVKDGILTVGEVLIGVFGQ